MTTPQCKGSRMWELDKRVKPVGDGKVVCPHCKKKVGVTALEQLRAHAPATPKK